MTRFFNECANASAKKTLITEWPDGSKSNRGRQYKGRDVSFLTLLDGLTEERRHIVAAFQDWRNAVMTQADYYGSV
jgi:hypothetical protein